MTRAQAWKEAERLVIHEGFSYEQAAGATGIARSTLEKRGAQDGWMGRRQAGASYDAGVRRMKALAQDRALKAMAGDLPGVDAAQAVYAWQSIERAYPEHRYGQTEEDPRMKLGVGIEVIELLVAYLTERARPALTALQPHLEGFAAHLEGAWLA